MIWGYPYFRKPPLEWDVPSTIHSHGDPPFMQTSIFAKGIVYPLGNIGSMLVFPRSLMFTGVEGLPVRDFKPVKCCIIVEARIVQKVNGFV